MTNDYKENLLKYLTGNIAQGIKSATPFYKESSKRENSDASITGYSISQNIGVLYCKDANGNNNGKVLVYGNGTNNQSTWHGYIQLFDNNYNLLKVFTAYDSGTLFDVFEKLNIDEIGQIYGIDYSSNKHRFIMLNNISEKGSLPDYQCVLRQSYFLQGDITNTYIYIGSNEMQTNMLSVDKSKQSALYFMSGLDGGRDVIYGTSFKINVGAENVWEEYDWGTVYRGQFIDSYVYFDKDDNISCNFYFSEVNMGDDTHQITRTYNTGTSISGYEVLASNLEQYVENILQVTGVVINEKKLYFGVSGYDSSNTMVKTFLYDNGSIVEAYSKINDVPYQSDETKAIFQNVNNLIFCIVQLANDTVNGVIAGSIYVNILSDEGINFENELEDKVYLAEDTVVIVSNDFNIYSVLCNYYPTDHDPGDIPELYTYITRYIHRNGYNGEQYEDKSSLLPKQGLLYDDNNNLVFARDLYNSKVYNERTIATVNVPNTYLNGITIANKMLIGDTNYIMVDDDISLEKNVYESLFVNFNNQLTMQNRNEENYVDNQGGAIRLNKSCSKVLDYDNSKATKIRVTYDDDTSYITSASNTITNNVCTYSIGVHVPNDRNIQKIEIISNDEITTYQTISNLSLENNKYYIITQDVYVV